MLYSVQFTTLKHHQWKINASMFIEPSCNRWSRELWLCNFLTLHLGKVIYLFIVYSYVQTHSGLTCTVLQTNFRSALKGHLDFMTLSYRPRQANLVLIAYASAQSRQNLRCSLIQAVSQEEPSDRKPDPWPLWMSGHAQLKFVMTECSKTQIRLTELIYDSVMLDFSVYTYITNHVWFLFPRFVPEKRKWGKVILMYNNKR